MFQTTTNLRNNRAIELSSCSSGPMTAKDCLKSYMHVSSLSTRCGERLQEIYEDLQRRSRSDQAQCHVDVETSKKNLHTERARNRAIEVELVKQSDKCERLRKANEKLQISGRKMEMEMMALRKRRSCKREHRD